MFSMVAPQTSCDQMDESPPSSSKVAAQETMRSRLKRHLEDVQVESGPFTPPPREQQPTLFEKLSGTHSAHKKPPAARNSGSPLVDPTPSANKRRRVEWREQEVRATPPPPNCNTWEPPASPFGLIEEQLFHDPWKLLLACILLNRTTATQVRRLWDDLMAVVPDATTAATADPQQLELIIQPLGFHRFRARAIVAMSQDYLRPWRRPSELRFVGKYASDAYFIFCRGKWMDVLPDDKDLKKYRDWLIQNGGEGSGLTRDDLL